MREKTVDDIHKATAVGYFNAYFLLTALLITSDLVYVDPYFMGLVCALDGNLTELNLLVSFD